MTRRMWVRNTIRAVQTTISNQNITTTSENNQKWKRSPPTKPISALTAAASGGGAMACPNTPELPRRNVKSAGTRSSASSQRQSVPRDTSLSRLAQQVPSSLASAKKQLLQTAANVPSTTTTQRSASSQRAQPRYLDISKYKPAQNPSRASNRSVRSATSVMTTSGTSLGGGSVRASSAARRDASKGSLGGRLCLGDFLYLDVLLSRHRGLEEPRSGIGGERREFLRAPTEDYNIGTTELKPGVTLKKKLRQPLVKVLVQLKRGGLWSRDFVVPDCTCVSQASMCFQGCK
ncbi:hypothetical protein EVAR_73792_1 [Eumeta japonica]|uniref:Uncharacterized protein n=1 Tax=Eumeta variegata TaxID=151549 RepID=A0A4C1T9H8_EUMVA|nr:hypothetical protein EVAR_73792_1 [Eumeta japonica]